MTVVSTVAGLVPVMISIATGSDVNHRIAAPILRGMLSVMVFNLLVLLVIYSFALQLWERKGTHRETGR